MSHVQRDRRAISAVLTTIVILVASMVLGSGVVVFSTSVFQSGGQQQAVQVIDLQGWVNNTAPAGYAWGAFAVKNIGDKIISVSSITERGVTVPFSNWYADSDPVRVAANFQAQLNITKGDNNGNPKGSVATGINLGTPTGSTSTQCALGVSYVNGVFICFVVQLIPYTNTTPVYLNELNGPLALTPGAAAIIYYKLPNGIYTTTDSGVTSTVSILAGNVPISQTVRLANN